MEANPWMHAEYVLRRKVFKLLGGAFEIFDPSGGLAFYSEQKALKLKEDIRLFADRQRQTELLTIQARSIVDFSAAYDVFDPVDSEKIGVLRRKGFSSMFRDSWEILDANDAPIARVREDSVALALIRRFLSNLIPQKFVVEIDGQTVATYRQNFNPFVHKIRLDFSADRDIQLDRRLGIATAILLCAIEGRQQ